MAYDISQMDTPAESGTDDASIVRMWNARWDASSRREERWRKKSVRVIETYRDKSVFDVVDTQLFNETADLKFNILWSNTETLRPALYLRTPKPDVRRRYRDSDAIGRQMAMVIERALSYSVDAYDFDDVIRGAVEDYLLPGRGTVRVRYVPTFEKVTPKQRVEPSVTIGPDGEEASAYPDGVEFDEEGAFIPGEPYDDLIDERVVCEYVLWENVRLGEARRWEDVPWVGFKGLWTRAECVAELGAELGNKIPLTETLDEFGDEKNSLDNLEMFKRAEVREIWDREKRKVYLICPSYSEKPLKEMDDPLQLREFFPIPRPLYSIRNNNTLVPMPEYLLYQDQAIELNKVTARIDRLTGALKVRGFYDSALGNEIGNVFNAGDNALIPVDDWERFAEKGGFAGVVSTAPLETIANTIRQLYVQREQIKQVIYEVTGISDIVRGASKASETATAQRIKGNFATLRLEDRRSEIHRFIRDLYELMAEVMAEHFSPETLQAMTGLQVTPEMMDILRSDGPREFRIDIETDETIMSDAAEEQRTATEFLTAAVSFINGIAPAVQSGVVPMDAAKSLLMAVSRRYKFGREVEDALDQIGQGASQAPAQLPAGGAGAGGVGDAPPLASPAAPGNPLQQIKAA